MRIPWPRMKHLSYNGTAAIYRDYLSVFEGQFGLSRGLADMLAHYGEEACEAEFRAIGSRVYTGSLLTCVRNAMYQAAVVEERYERLIQLGIKTPVLDYGCGVGFLCRYLESRGIEPCYGYELSGLQTKVAGAAGVMLWTRQPVATVTCFNVLEHESDPVMMLNRLRQYGRVIANICTGKKHAHIASEDKLMECKRMLESDGGLY